MLWFDRDSNQGLSLTVRTLQLSHRATRSSHTQLFIINLLHLHKHCWTYYNKWFVSKPLKSEKQLFPTKGKENPYCINRYILMLVLVTSSLYDWPNTSSKCFIHDRSRDVLTAYRTILPENINMTLYIAYINTTKLRVITVFSCICWQNNDT